MFLVQASVTYAVEINLNIDRLTLSSAPVSSGLRSQRIKVSEAEPCPRALGIKLGIVFLNSMVRVINQTLKRS